MQDDHVLLADIQALLVAADVDVGLDDGQHDVAFDPAQLFAARQDVGLCPTHLRRRPTAGVDRLVDGDRTGQGAAFGREVDALLEEGAAALIEALAELLPGEGALGRRGDRGTVAGPRLDQVLVGEAQLGPLFLQVGVRLIGERDRVAQALGMRRGRRRSHHGRSASARGQPPAKACRHLCEIPCRTPLASVNRGR